jgi:hypothetical protein
MKGEEEKDKGDKTRDMKKVIIFLYHLHLVLVTKKHHKKLTSC